MTNFLGIKQVKRATFDSIKNDADKLGYLWLVNNGTGTTSSTQYELYFGTRKYGSNADNAYDFINKVTASFGELLNKWGEFVFPVGEDVFINVDESQVTNLYELLKALDAAIATKLDASDLNGLNDEVAKLKEAINNCLTGVNVAISDTEIIAGDVANGVVTIDLKSAFAAAGKVKGITVDGNEVEINENGIVDIDLSGKADDSTVTALAERVATLEDFEHADDVVYDEGSKYIYLTAGGQKLGNGFSAADFLVDGMLKSVDFVKDAENKNTTTLRFTFNADGEDKVIDVNFADYVDTYRGDGTSIELNSSTNTFSVKNVEATKTTLTSSIEVNGGPLADDSTGENDKWPEDWYENGVKVIPSGKSMEEILTSLFLKITNGTVKKESITWSPSLSAPSVSISKSGTVEVGTKLTATANTTNTVSNNSRTCVFTCSPGHFLSTGVDENGKLIFGSYASGSKTVTANTVNPSYDGTPSVKTYWNGEEVTNVNGTTEYTVSEVGTNTFKVDQSGVTAYAGAFDDITVYGSTNTKVPVESVKASITGDAAPAAKPLTSTANKTITGARAYWMGAMATPLTEFTSDSIRKAGEDENSGLVKTLGADPATTLEVPAGEYDVVIVTQKEIKEVTSKAQFGSAITGNFTANHTEENIEGANGFKAIKYHVYHCKTNWDADILTISYK